MELAYQISYGTGKETGHPDTIHPVRTIVLSIVCSILFLSFVYRRWPEGMKVMDKLLSYLEFVHPKEALEAIAKELRNGTNLSDAVTAFCQEVIRSGIAFAA